MAFIYNLTAIWNDAGTTFSGIKLNVTDTASAAGSALMDLQVGGASKFKVGKNGSITVPSFTNNNLGGTRIGGDGNWLVDLGYWQAGRIVAARFGLGTLGYDPDILLERDAANQLALRNGTNAQTLRTYNTYTNASNYERAKFAWESNVLTIGTEAAGTGIKRNLVLDGANRAAYDAAPAAATIRDILISHGLMAAA